MIFLDTNIFLRALLNDHRQWSHKCQEILEKINKGDFQATTTDLTVAEVVFMLQSKVSGKLSKIEISRLLLPVVSLVNLTTPAKGYWKEIFGLYVEKNIDITDAYNIVMMKNQGIETAYSYDRDFDKVKYIKRIEP